MKESIAGIIFHDSRFLIGHRLGTGEMANRWEFPGGKVDPGETPEQAIIREFSEEMDVSVTPGELLTTVEFSNKNGPSRLLAYRVTGITELPTRLTEHTELRWANLDEIDSLSFVDSDKLLLPFLRTWSVHA